MTTPWTTTPARPEDPDAATLLREYLDEMVRRYHRRPARPGEVDAALAEFPSDDLAPPAGLFLLARFGRGLAGGAGLRRHADWAELTIPAFSAGPYAEHWFEKVLLVDDPAKTGIRKLSHHDST